MTTQLQQQMDNNDNWLKGLFVLLILALIWLCTSCSCNWHLDKAKKKCGITTEVITLHDTITIEEVRNDTVFKYFQKDTVIVREGKLVMKYFYNSHDSTVYLQGKSLSDTIVKIIKVPTTTIETNWFDKFKWFIYIGGLLVFIYFIIKLLK